MKLSDAELQAWVEYFKLLIEIEKPTTLSTDETD